MSKDRTKLIDTVLRLRALGEGAGTEAEALGALAKADNLMKAYRLSEAEIALAETQGQVDVEIVHMQTDPMRVNPRSRVRHKACSCITRVGEYTETHPITLSRNGAVEFTGDKADVELAVWMMGMIRDAMGRAYESWKAGQQSVGRSAKGTFQIAMAQAINSRLYSMTAARDAERRKAKAEAAKALAVDPSVVEAMVAPEAMAELTSTALVVVAAAERKKVESLKAYEARHPTRRKTPGFTYRAGTSAYAAGQSAGRNVNLSRPVNGGGARGLLQ